MEKERFEKLVEVLEKQMSMIETLNEATRGESSCGCCGGNTPIKYKEIEELRGEIEFLKE